MFLSKLAWSRDVTGKVDNIHSNLGQSFNLIHSNVRSLSKNKHKIEELLQSVKTKPDILAISESKLYSNNLRRTSLLDFSMVHCDSMSNAGGVALYVSNSLEFCKLDKCSIASPYLKKIFIEVKLKNSAKGVVISVIYRHSSTSLSGFKLQFTQTISFLAKHKKRLHNLWRFQCRSSQKPVFSTC